ncbi:MAG: hypothetical protein KJ697_02600 [Nanoarchaeota archaeon]|nr:hypothetical protein [Nanoarchaeota archaeon]MBU4124043.1 hypothetical protein [Nanoarchaeota archaeon]
MISIERQQGLLLAISERLEKKITVYAVGGTAMMFLGLKDSTLDIDLVFENKNEKNSFKEAIISLGYKEFDAKIVYGGRANRPEMLTLGDERFDLFVKEVIDFIFSENMQKRAGQTHQFGNNLILKIADPHDIILMKCATDRIKDLDDARNIINGREIDWKLIIEEAKNQIKLGKVRAVFDLGCFVEKLEKEFKMTALKKIVDEIWDLVSEEAEEKKQERR